MIFYSMDAAHEVDDYLQLDFTDDVFDEIAAPCAKSEFQYLDRKPLIINLDESINTKNVINPDFIYERGIPIISDKFKSFLNECKVDYLLYKKIILRKESDGWEEIYWLALPPRINCLDRENSEINEILNYASNIVVDADKIGRYEIFKLSGITNTDIIITENMAHKIQDEDFIGVHVFKLN